MINPLSGLPVSGHGLNLGGAGLEKPQTGETPFAEINIC